MLKAKVDFPEPEGPVTTVSALCGIAAVRFLRLCSRAPSTAIARFSKRSDCIERPIARVGIAGTRKGSRFFSKGGRLKKLSRVASPARARRQAASAVPVSVAASHIWSGVPVKTT